MQRNRYTVDLQARKFLGVAYSTSTIISKFPSPTVSPHINSLSVLNAAAHGHGETNKASLKAILRLLDNRPNDVGLILTIIQLYVLMNNPGPAIALLESFFKRLEASTSPTDLDVRYAPGLVALTVSLYRLSGRKNPITNELSKAASHWRRKSKDHSSSSLLRAAGISLLESSKTGDFEKAGEIFSSLKEQNPNDRTAIAGYVASYATSDFSKVEKESQKLTAVSRLISGVDASALENAGIPSLSVAPVPIKKRPALGEKEKEGQSAKKRKIRKGKMPKDYVEGKKMDPERWLPLRDRSSYKPKGKKGKKKAADLTQGGVVKEPGESLELAGGAGVVKVQQAGGGGGNKKKKGKGKK